jgi:hypothetical protein
MRSALLTPPRADARPDSIKRGADSPRPAMEVRVSRARPQQVTVAVASTHMAVDAHAGCSHAQRDAEDCAQSPQVPGPSSESASMATSSPAAVQPGIGENHVRHAGQRAALRSVGQGDGPVVAS